MATTREDRQRAVKQMLASWALEADAWEPDAEYLALLDRYIDGELTLAELSAHTDAKFGINPKPSTINEEERARRQANVD